jgi:hypothetical protein
MEQDMLTPENRGGMVGMERRRYYVSVQAKTVMVNQGDAAYELEIEATPIEVELLHELFESESEADFQNFMRAHNPTLIVDELVSHEHEDLYLAEAYRLIYQLGTPQTREHIRTMNVLHGIDPEAEQS